jgi:hypothetical protein
LVRSIAIVVLTAWNLYGQCPPQKGGDLIFSTFVDHGIEYPRMPKDLLNLDVGKYFSSIKLISGDGELEGKSRRAFLGLCLQLCGLTSVGDRDFFFSVKTPVWKILLVNFPGLNSPVPGRDAPLLINNMESVKELMFRLAKQK